MAPEPMVDGKGTHGGYCGPAVKPIALHMVAEIARDPECKNIPVSAIGGIETWRDAAEFVAVGAGTVQVCTAAMHYGFKIVDDMIDGLERWMEQGALRPDRGFSRPRGQERHRLAVPEPQLQDHRRDRPGYVHQMRPVPCRVRGHLAPGGRGPAQQRPPL